MNPHETMQFNKCEEVRLPKETMIIDQDYLEFTNKGEKNG